MGGPCDTVGHGAHLSFSPTLGDGHPAFPGPLRPLPQLLRTKGSVPSPLLCGQMALSSSPWACAYELRRPPGWDTLLGVPTRVTL